MSLWIGLLLSVSAVVMLFSSDLAEAGEDMDKDTSDRRNFWLHVAAMAGLVVGISVLGIVTATALYLLVCVWLIAGHNWITIVSVVVGVSAATVLIFEHWLNISLPTGFFGF